MTERLDADETRARLDYPALVEALECAVVEVAERRIECPPRLVVPMTDGALLLSMPAVADDVAIHKLITVAPGNPARGLPAILGTVTAIDPGSGRPLLILDGPTVTGRRTAAMSMLATKLLQSGPVEHALLIGTGVQAGHHAEALAAIFPDAVVHVRGTSDASTHDFCDRHRDVAPTLQPDDGTAEPDVVFTCTTSRVPVYRAPADPRRLVVATGAFEAHAAEIDPAVVRASVVYVDDPDGARHEAGDLLRAGIDWSTVRPLAAALVGPRRVLRQSTLVKTVGCAAWDLAAARVALAGLP